MFVTFFFPEKWVTSTLYSWIRKQQNSMFSNCYFSSSRRKVFFHDKETKMVHWIFHFLINNGFSWLNLKTLLHRLIYFTTHYFSDVVLNQIHYTYVHQMKFHGRYEFEWNFIGQRSVSVRLKVPRKTKKGQFGPFLFKKECRFNTGIQT